MTEIERWQEIERRAYALSSAMLSAEVYGANFDLIDKEWQQLTEALMSEPDVAQPGSPPGVGRGS